MKSSIFKKLFAIFYSLFQIIEKDINPYVDEWENKKAFPAHKVFKILGDNGFLGVNKPVGKNTILNFAEI